MSAEKIDLEIVTPDRRVIAETVDEIVLPGREGYLGILPGHAPLLTSLSIGEISYRVGGQMRYLAVAGGYVEVLRDRVSVLAETCEFAEEIDLERAQTARKQAETELAAVSGQAFGRAAVRLRRAVTRVQVHGKGDRA